MVFFRNTQWSRLGFAVAFLFGGGALTSFAQVSDDQRLDQKLNRRVVESQGDRATTSREGLDISLITTLAYDSNIFLEADDEVGSLVAQVEPTIGWTAGEREKAWVRLAYACLLYTSPSPRDRG